MKRRFRLIAEHWLQSLLMSSVAGGIVILLRPYMSRRWGFLVDGLAERSFLIPVIGAVLPMLLAIVWPVRMIAGLYAVRLFPMHIGTCLKTILSIFIVVAVDFGLLGNEYYYPMDTSLLVSLAAAFAVGTITAYGYARWMTQPRSISGRADGPAGPDTWLAGDEPAKSLADNKFPEHESVASRILARLLSGRAEDSWLVPNVALIGPYGSGKTSICNLVESLYMDKVGAEHLPKILFCRYEAWQFLSPEAATRGLVRTITERLLQVTDDLMLGKVPDRYIQAIGECAGPWAKPIILSVSGSDDPRTVLSAIGDTLVRLNMRVVVFVDDFDRIERDCPATQQAVAKALNQFQGIPNLQYVITVGPTRPGGGETIASHASWDLLKLTRHQELVPTIDPGQLVELARKCRDHSQEDRECSFPWAYARESDSDPLAFDAAFACLYSGLGLTGYLAGLVSTPRACKAILRETMKAWADGLKGEIDWYDLLLINAIKATEPGVFEWIARDPDVFLEESTTPTGNRDREQEAKYAQELKTRFDASVSSREPKHSEAVKKALAHLFPYFNAKLELGIVAHVSSVAPDSWSQRISLQAGSHSDYLRRFFAGGVPQNDVPDQPTLQYIRKTIERGFMEKDFVALYLDTREKLTGPLNKIVQFAGLIPRRLAFQISDAVLDWVADPTHATMWPEPDRFMIAVLPDVFTIVNQAESSIRHRRPVDATAAREAGDEAYEWAQAVVKRHMARAPLLAVTFAKGFIERGYTRVIEQLPQTVCKEFTDHFIEKGVPLLPGLMVSPYSLAWLLGDLRQMLHGDEYAAIRTPLTKALISQTKGADGQQMFQRIVFSLVEMTSPIRSGEISLDEYGFAVNKRANEARYDMDQLLPVIRGWSSPQADALTGRALSYLKQAYDLA